MGTIDQIYVLNYMINKGVAEKKGKMVILFLDMKAAFDSVDGEILRETMRKRGVRKKLVVRCEEVLKETVSRVRVEEEGEKFWINRGVRQGCFLSLCLFTLLIADLDEALEEEEWDEIKVGRKRIYSLACADNVAVVAEMKDEMKGIIKR